MSPTTDHEGTPMTDRPPRRLSRRRDCDLATSHDLEALDQVGVRYEIVETSGEATTLRFSHSDLSDLRDAVLARTQAEVNLEQAHGIIAGLRRQIQTMTGTAA